MNKSRKKLLFILLPVLLLLAAAGVLYYLYQTYYIKYTYVPASFQESADALENPYRGFYRMYGYSLAEDNPKLSNTLNTHVTEARDDLRLVLLEINLKQYRDGSISDTGLSQLEEILSRWSGSGRQIILRFLYDWDGKAKETEPEELQTIFQHMDQCALVLNPYKDHIYIIQGIFVGNHGEMNNSNFMSVEHMLALMEHLSSVIDPDIFLAVRTPTHWRQITGSRDPLPEEDAYSGTINTRIGLFNDGMLGSGNDLGTYGEDDLTQTRDLAAKGHRNQELAFQNQLCNYVPNGGEVVLDNSYNDFENAVSDLNTMHVSYLNCDYDAAVLDKWRNAVYNGSGPFQGLSGYDYMDAHLGYRYVLRSGSLAFDTLRDQEATLSVSLENTGFSSGYVNFPMTITLENMDTGAHTALLPETDTRYWLPKEEFILTLPIDIRSLEPGTYGLYLSLTDPAGKEGTDNILFANSEAPTDLGYSLGTLTIEE